MLTDSIYHKHTPFIIILEIKIVVKVESGQQSGVSSAADIRQILTAAGIIRDGFDVFCSSAEKMLAAVEDCEQTIKRLDDLKLSNQEVIQQILEGLPPKNASALLAAVIGMGELLPSGLSGDAEEQIRTLREGLDHMQRIRDNLHAALDGVV